VVNEWTRAERLALYSLLVASIAVIVALFIPEFRRILGLPSESVKGSPQVESNAGGSLPESSVPISNSFRFSVNRTGPHFSSGLPLVGGYEIAIPGDNKWHDTNIVVRPSYQLQIDFTDFTQGPVNIQVGEISGFMQNALQNGAYYEYNFVARLRNNPYDHVLAHEANLKVRSTNGNVFIKVDVRQGDLY
jgi:hypothetical protein